MIVSRSANRRPPPPLEYRVFLFPSAVGYRVLHAPKFLFLPNPIRCRSQPIDPDDQKRWPEVISKGQDVQVHSNKEESIQRH